MITGMTSITNKELIEMYEENDYIMRQIKAMVRGLGKFMGLEQIKDLLQLSEDQQITMTDRELETIIAVSKIELILANSSVTINDLVIEANIDEEQLQKFLNTEVIASEQELNQLNNFINQNQQFL